MSEKYTPGPWRVNDTNRRGDLFIAVEGDRNALVVAEMLPSFLPGENCYGCVEANARLIAASPDLLAACKAAFKLLPANAENIYLTDGVHHQANILLSVAIAKAEEE